MKTLRNGKGHWLPGVSGNPSGRPVGARDKRRRFRCAGSQPWARMNLGVHGIFGGPGRPKGSRNRTAQSKVAEGVALTAELEALPNASLTAWCRALELVSANDG